jgi:hypothetical protein
MAGVDDRERVGDMTRAELRAFVTHVVLEQLEVWYVPKQRQPLADLLTSMQQNIIEPQSGQPSAVDMVLEDRQQWNTG